MLDKQTGLGEPDPEPGCPACGALSAAPGYRGHAGGCPRYYKEESE